MNAAAGFPRPFGRYVLEKSISRGGMGEVFLAVAKGVHQRCVIKTIRTDLHGEREFVGRFTDEAKIMVRIEHPNIIRVFDCGKVGDDYYIAMEYVHGRDLGDVLDRAYERGEPMPTQLGLYMAVQLLAGLGHVHGLTDEKGRHMRLVHRDVSPQNVLVGFDGSVKLIDFGLARSDLLPARTQGALAVGKYGYMSPEQARHQELDGRADIYSAGVMLFEVFTGDRLVDEQDQATLWERVLNPQHRTPRSVIPSLPPEIDDLIMTAVATRPAQRFSNAAKMQGFCERLLESRDHAQHLVRYLRYLYPTVDFAPPPVPALDGFVERVDQSVIIATSRKKQRSVFGRGELPVEGTMQFDARALREALDEARSAATRTRAGFEEPSLGFSDQTASETWVSTDTDNRPTQVASHPMRPDSEEEGPDQLSTRVQSSPAAATRPGQVQAFAAGGATLADHHEEDEEEQTVMMSFSATVEDPDPILESTVLSRRTERPAPPKKPVIRPRFVPVEEVSARPLLDPKGSAPRDGGAVSAVEPSLDENTLEGPMEPIGGAQVQVTVEPKLGPLFLSLVVLGACLMGFLAYGLITLF